MCKVTEIKWQKPLLKPKERHILQPKDKELKKEKEFFYQNINK